MSEQREVQRLFQQERDEDRLRKVIREELDAWGTRIGLNTEDPMSQQEDFRHLRRWRHIVESSSMRVAVTTVSFFVAAFLGLVWFGITKGSK